MQIKYSVIYMQGKNTGQGVMNNKKMGMPVADCVEKFNQKLQYYD